MASRGPAEQAAYNERRRANRQPGEDTSRKRGYRIRKGYTPASRPFVGIDGEGGNVNGRHEYLLLTAGANTLHTGQPLTTLECLEFIATLDPTPTYVGYFFDYDVTMMVRGLPDERLYRLMDRDVRTRPHPKDLTRYVTWPLDYENYQLDYLPHKEFRVRKKLGDKWGRWVTVNDVGSFFQCSFVAALEQWQIGTEVEREMIAAGKSQRASFAELTEDVIAYNALEIRLLHDLMEGFRDVCNQTGYVPTRWQGPGNMASAMLRHHRVPTRKTLSIPDDVIELANAAYYGGRFETTAVGPVYGGVHEYDINSAYPTAMRSLPCLLHSRWVRGNPHLRDGVSDGLTLAHGTYRATEPATLYGLPSRNKHGSISYRSAGSGAYWSVETNRLSHQVFTPDRSWTLVPADCGCDPFGWILPIYRERIRVGKTAKGRVLKLGLNSLYGKQAQSVGAAPYANPVYAGLITAMTRATLADAAHAGPSCCDDVYMLATDALYTGHPRNLTIGKGLGEWDAKHHDEMFIIQPGLYFTDSNVQPKTRGIPRQAAVEARQAFRDTYGRVIVTGDVMGETVPVPLRQFIGARLAVARNKPGTAGEWVEVVKQVGFEWSNKRHPQDCRYDPAPNPDEWPTLRTVPLAGDVNLESVPYSKDIGRMLHLKMLEDGADNPDYADQLFTMGG